MTRYFPILLCQLLLIFGLCVVTSIPTIAQTAEVSTAEQMKGWKIELDRIEQEVATSESIKLDKHNKWQSTLDNIRQEANQLADSTAEKLKAEREVLKALGDAPEDSSNEAASIREQRRQLNEVISAVDAELKRANFTIARVNEIEETIDTRQQEQTRSKLFTKGMMVVNPDSWPRISDELVGFIATFNQPVSLIYLALGMLAIIALSFPVTTYLNNFFQKAPYIHLNTPFSRKRLLLMAAAIYVVLLLRFGLLSFGEYTALEDALQTIASICLALILFGMLGKFEFVANLSNDERLGEKKHSYHGLYNNAKRLVRLVLMAVPIASLIGYVNLTVYLSFNIALSFIAIVLFIWLRGLAVKVVHKLTPHEEAHEKELSPLAVSIIEPVLALFSLMLILFFWGMTTEDIAGWFGEFKHGIKLGDITIDFVSIGAAIGLFFILWLATKVLQWFLSSRVFQNTKLDSGIRDAIIAITGYVGIIFALLVAMGAIGLNMSNLAIVAGALSVGIGFGLQAIFNNFVSGLILLFERPVKVGDWVIVGEHQGVIKKIRVRSTEIETFWNSSVIVPNSQLISETVTNWTLHDRAGRVDVAVGVAYGSDTEKVKNVLLEVAKQHPEVRSYPESKVIFTEFGDSSLNFELRCFINNIRDVFVVTSELRFAVDSAFREHQIEIPFPQRDLHIRSAEPLTVNNGKSNDQ